MAAGVAAEPAPRERPDRAGPPGAPRQPARRGARATGGGGIGGTTGVAGSTARGGTSGGAGNGGSPAAPARRAARGTTGSAGGTGGATSPPVSKYIVVDQFGYLPDLEKIAVIRDPQTGFDATESFTPGATYALVNAATGARVFMAAPTAWNGGATDASSGDKAWWFTFTSVTTPGDYYVLDVDRQRAVVHVPRSATTVYRDVLKQAVRMLFYQRAGQAKDAAHAGAGWTDAASFTGALQDQHCRLFSDKNNAATERDLRGGWYDAGDLNKYTSWTAGYVETLLRAYAENPTIWTDDYNIPESGNGIPDVLDEAKWGLDFLVRMQGTDGSVLSIVGEPAASPPSAATGQSLYGPANTSATLATAAAFARGRAHPEAAQQRRAEHRRRRSAARARRPPGRGRSRTRTCSSRTTTARPDRRGSAPGSRRPTTTGASPTSWTRRRSCSPRPATRPTRRSSTPTTASFT